MFKWVTGMLAALAGHLRSLARRISLFELLVWVAIAALLASIMLPALQHAKLLAERAAAAKGMTE